MNEDSPLSRSPKSDPTELYRARDGLFAVELLVAAIAHLDLFGCLAKKPLRLNDLCERLSIQERPADVMVTLLVAMGLLGRDGELISNTERAREFLSDTSPWSLRPYYDSARDRPVVNSMLEVLRTGMPANWSAQDDDWAAKMTDEAFARAFTGEMNCRGVYLGPIMARRMDLASHTHVLDIGGGSGVYACAMAAAHPHLRGTVLEKPPVDRIARETIASHGLADRVDVVAADMFSDPLPEADIHLYSNVVHDWNETNVRRLLERSAEALPPGGLLAIHDAHINREKTGPLHVAEYSVLLMHFTEGKCYSIAELESMLAHAGFVDMRETDVAVARSVVTARRG